jgi:hypothetical protein
MPNVYFELTREFNARGRIAVLTSGQAVVWYRTAMMSKDGDWILAEAPSACDRILDVLESRRGRYRTGAPLDVRWLSGGWSSHFEFRDEKGRRVRCDFLTRPPRVDPDARHTLFDSPGSVKGLDVIDLENLIRMKRTQRAKDHVVIGELARRLPPEREILYTTDPDRIIGLASTYGREIRRLPVAVAVGGGSREDVAIAVARETWAFQEADRLRVERYEAASREYRARVLKSGVAELPLLDAHARLVELATAHLPTTVETEGE